MIRFAAIASFLLGASAFAQQDPGQGMTEEQQCQRKCGAAMTQCMMPCVGNPSEAEKPENRSKTMGCVKKCAEGQEPCMKACEKKKPKK
jgi:hypothetical protein